MAFQDSPECPDFYAFLDAGGRKKAEELVDKYRMDDSLRFRRQGINTARKEQKPRTSSAGAPDVPEISADREEDFHAVACPLNYVKTKLILDSMEPGQVLSVLLGEDGAKNVPKSAEKDGYEVLAVAKAGDYRRVFVRRP